MFTRISRGWGIVKASAVVLRQYPKLILFPVASGLALAAVFGLILWPIIATMPFDQTEKFSIQFDAYNPQLYLIIAAVNFVFFAVAIFFNSALIFCALQAFAGKTPSLRAGLGQAVARLPQILAWAFIAATVGMLLSALQNFLRDRLGFLGSLLGGLLEMSWAILTVFVVPVVVVEGVGPIEAVKRSTAILRRTWGESLTGQASLGGISALLMIPILVLGVLAILVAGGVDAAPPAAFLIIGALVLAAMFAIGIIFGTLGTIFNTGTYIYATTGKAPSVFDQSMMQAAFQPKKKR